MAKNTTTTKKKPTPAAAKTKTTAKSIVKKTVSVSNNALAKLNTWNKSLAVLHLIQGVAVIVLANARGFSIHTNYLTVDSLASAGGNPVLVSASHNVFSLNLAYLVAAFFFMSALAHLVIATVYRDQYEADLRQGINKARWIEYGLSASTMMVGIAVLSGVADVASLFMIFMLTAIMNLMGLMMEVHNQTTKKTNWLSYYIGVKSGLAPWIVVALYLISTNVYGNGRIPTFVYWIFGSMLVLFSSFAVNMFLQYKKKGKWANYLYGERVYMILSLVAKSVLAWQIFFGALRP
jgi:hypothetical protein